MIKAACNHLINQLIKHFNNISIRTKLLVFFFIITVIPLFVITFTNYGIISSETQDHTVYAADRMFDQSISMVDNKIKAIMDVSMTISMDSGAIQKILQQKSPDYFDSTILQYEDYLQLNEFLTSYRKYDSISSLMLYVPERFSFADQYATFYNLDNIKETGWYRELINSTGQLKWFETSDVTGIPSKTVSAFRKIRNLSYLPEILGLIRIDMDKALFSNIFDEVMLTPNSKVYIANSKHQVIATNIHENLSDFSEELNQKMTDNSNSWNEARLVSGSFLYRTRDIQNTDWKVTVFIPFSDLLSASDKARNNIFVIALIVSVIAYLLAYLFSRTLTNRIKLLIKYMKNVDRGNFNVEILSQSSDEIGQLIQNFNYMLTKMSMLMDEKISIGKEIKAAELKALQSQINPHFLYNTLDLIQWRAINRNVPEISTLVKSLAKYYKLLLSRGEDTVPLKDEFEHVRIYVAIQNERFSNCLVLETDMDKTLADFLLPKLLLQPIVENSLHHGILEKHENSGYIKVKAWQDGESVFITVEDDGVGMTQGSCDSILTLSQQNKNNGSNYGVKNIYDRIILFFGSEASINYESTLGIGTKVTIKAAGHPFQGRLASPARFQCPAGSFQKEARCNPQ